MYQAARSGGTWNSARQARLGGSAGCAGNMLRARIGSGVFLASSCDTPEGRNTCQCVRMQTSKYADSMTKRQAVTNDPKELQT